MPDGISPGKQKPRRRESSVVRLAKQFPFRTIVVATDFSEESSAALRCAQAIAKHQHAMLLLVHVIDPVCYAFPNGAPPSVDHDAAAHEELTRIETEVRQQGIPVHSKIETGIVCERILLSLRDHKAALLVLGTKAITGAGRAALGALTRRLLAHSPCPILTVAPDTPGQPRRFAAWNNILVGTDFSAASLNALQYAQRIAGNHLIVLHSARCGRHLECPNCLERLRFLAPFNEQHGLPVDHTVTGGEPAGVIIEAAQRLHPDLIVLGGPSPAHDERDLDSSTVVKVISSVSAPVLIVPEGRTRHAEEVIEEVEQVG